MVTKVRIPGRVIFSFGFSGLGILIAWLHRMELELPQGRAVNYGTKSLSDRELLCVILHESLQLSSNVGSIREDIVVDSLLRRFGTLDEVFRATREELSVIEDLLPPQAARILAVKEICTRIFGFSDLRSAWVNHLADAYRLFTDLAFEPQEVLCAAYLTVQHRVLRKEIVFRGTLDSSLARPREIIRGALRVNAGRIVVAHNHPSDNLEPSEEDLMFTRDLENAAFLMGMPLLDHLILGPSGKFYSFSESKRLTLIGGSDGDG